MYCEYYKKLQIIRLINFINIITLILLFKSMNKYVSLNVGRVEKYTILVVQ